MIKLLKISLSLVLFLFVASSCSPVVSELWLNKDQSGRMATSFDLGEMAGMAQGMISELGEDEDNEDGPGGMWGDEERMDTTMNFYDIMPDSIKEITKNPELLKNVNLNMFIDSKKEEAKMTLDIAFKSEAHLNEIFEVMQSVKEDDAGDEEQFRNMVIDYKFDLKRGIIQLPGMDLSKLEEDPEFGQIMGSLDSLSTADPEKMEMFEMLFGGETKLIVHAPGKIQFTNDMNAVIDGNTVTFTNNLMEMIQSKKSIDRIIKLKD